MRVVTQSKQFRSDPSELIFVELCELFPHLLALVSVDRFVVIASNLDVVLPKLSLVWRRWCHFFHFEKDAAHDVDTQNVGECDQQADAAQSQQLKRFISGIDLLFHEILETWVDVLEDQID